MAHDQHSHEIINPGTFEISTGLRTLLFLFVVIGAATFGAALSLDPTRAWTSFITNHFYFMMLGVGGIFFAALQWLTGAMWSAPVRRLSESFSAYLPFALVSFIILYFGMNHLYSWTHVTKGDLVLEGKAGYLNVTFFMIRNIIALGLWIILARKMVFNSTAQDTTKDYKYSLKNRVLAPAFILIFGVTFTMASFDQMMSLDPHWYSTMFGVYCFAGLFYSTLALTCLLTLFLKGRGRLEGIINENHLHDLGKFMFAFTIFWAYIGFSQFMLIWYANLPEETEYFIRRMQGGWGCVSLFLLIGKFMLPFFFLLPRDAKRNEKILAGVGVFMMIAQMVDVMWMVQPEFYADGPRFGLVEIGMTLGFIGIFGLLVSRFLGKYNIVAIGDPRIAESIHHHHQ